jgi:hypothetical protein
MSLNPHIVIQMLPLSATLPLVKGALEDPFQTKEVSNHVKIFSPPVLCGNGAEKNWESHLKCSLLERISQVDSTRPKRAQAFRLILFIKGPYQYEWQENDTIVRQMHPLEEMDYKKDAKLQAHWGGRRGVAA